MDSLIEINGVKFAPLPGVQYRHNYVQAAKNIASKKWDDRGAYRALIENDLFFIVNFILRIPIANHPFVVKMCREVEDGPKDFTLDVWAREHFKSSIITIAETIQHTLTHPNEATGIFSYVRPVAKMFLGSIKDVFQKERILSYCFPEVVYGDCEKEATQWSLDGGLILNRQSSRKEPNVSAWGLVEGMPTGLHFERRIYDDISTQDMADSPDLMEKVKDKFDSSQNIGTSEGTHRVIGTYYHHSDPLTYIRGKRDLQGEPKYHYRLRTGSHDGTANGTPVFVSEKRWEDLKLTRTFNCQQLCDPSPLSEQKLNPEYLNPIERRLIPKGLYRFMLIDQAGDLDSAKAKTGMDSWAFGVVGVEPFTDDIGQSRVFLEDLFISPMSESEAIEEIVRMYIRAGMIMRLGVEKVGVSTTHVHIERALRAAGRHISFDPGSTGVLLRPAGRNKKKMIESALSWPLNNGKIFYSTSIPNNFMDRLKLEMTNFPVWHDDGINMLAYLWDLLKDMYFGMAEEQSELEKRRRYEPKQPVRSWMSV